MSQTYVNLSSVVEPNGKTILENNLQRTHNIPLGALVEVKFDSWHGDGACSKTHARLWVVRRGRDCDGTPLYWLSHERNSLQFSDETKDEATSGYDGMLEYYFGDHAIKRYPKLFELLTKRLHAWQGGFSEECLTVIEVTPEITRGENSLNWED